MIDAGRRQPPGDERSHPVPKHVDPWGSSREGKLKRVETDEGVVQTLADAASVRGGRRRM